MIMVSGAFTFDTPLFECKINGVWEECEHLDACELNKEDRHIRYDSPNTITKEFDIICEDYYLKSVALAMHFAGAAIGMYIFFLLFD